MLDWLTFLTSAIAAIGAVGGPVVAYRTASRAMRREEEQTRRDRRQERVDVAVQYALSDNPVIAEMGVKQLMYLLQAGELSADQKVAVVSAMEASLELTAQALGPGQQTQAVLAPDAADWSQARVAWVPSESDDAGRKGDRP